MKFFQQKTPITGTIFASSDKSCSHRALILASQMVGVTKISNLLESEDVLATKNSLEKLGVKIEKKEAIYYVYGSGRSSLVSPEEVLDLGNSGTGVRLLMGLIATQPVQAVFTGDKSLSNRPMGRVLEPLNNFNFEAVARDNNFLPVHITGNSDAVAINYELKVASAQVKTAMLLAALNAHGESKVIEKEFTRDHTELMMQYLGLNLQVKESSSLKEITLNVEEDLPAKDINVNGDPSSAAFLVAAALLIEGSEILVKNIMINKYRIGFYEVLKMMGANITFENIREDSGEKIADIRAKYSKLKAVLVPAHFAASMIDEYPILAILAAKAEGTTRMVGLAELRVKESDRLIAIYNNLIKCGVEAEHGDDWLEVSFCNEVVATQTIETFHDHRIAMSFLILGLTAPDGVAVDDIKMINTSFPEFFSRLKELGVKID
ncbi:MAG: 3-phosphoshikimate 1-carboxyvinyltransferase [Alphaproteobacteria bacterium]|jgi:3-phosphoshikimate 1-carboxyvinyltransferase|nr:3-phosphoshikimate 1-carboxyvinyltransferase [Alphaproteobacteria bacterium]MBT5828181.1 3-phosphoshikimate 1-carboxyvinyltransferase [Alphaproteobacteria bacterium]